MLRTLQRCIQSERPIQLTLMAFPFKVPNPAKVGSRKLPDFAELSAIYHLRSLKEAIQAVYPPGLELHILHDGSLIGDLFGIDLQEIREYESYFSDLVALAQASNFIRCHDFVVLQRLSKLNPTGSIEQLQLASERWLYERRGTDEWRRIFHKTLGMINLREFSTSQVVTLMSESSLGQLSPGYANLQRRVLEAMVQYRVKDTIIHQFDPRPHRFQDAIHTTTQDRPGRLAIWLVRRGRSLLPWHGVGCLDSRGRAEVVHAADICEKDNCYAEFISGEKTPFVFRKLSDSAPGNRQDSKPAENRVERLFVAKRRQ
jgi:pyoverdine/dityrosine biosynthesis protein Dit1